MGPPGHLYSRSPPPSPPSYNERVVGNLEVGLLGKAKRHSPTKIEGR